ncbi:hypothetical protein LB542_08485 [Mesorhizobium sp. BR1-1-9]|uniref:hypothetical protein n=1 Tax=Mesorhizobium sp. BR1-1-9 TaxID=2876646 RepID=UPI001CD0CFFB|nr:hypothetical protein [Mesorhizobium sp. BR1-1-9]MBZ9870896.1 hypothetical protein [Mesorhizobium sp. BR1-1-9]
MPTFVRDAIFQNCVFQLSALLEDYLLELTSQWLSGLTAAGATNSRMPMITRALFAARSQEELHRRFIALGDETELAIGTSEQLAVFGLLRDDDQMPVLDLVSKLIKDRKFPSIRNLEVLFRRLGKPKMTQALSKRTKTNVELALQAFMDVRNVLAHEGPPSITDLDVGRYFERVDAWIEGIDREFYGHVVKTSGAQYWQ